VLDNGPIIIIIIITTTTRCFWRRSVSQSTYDGRTVGAEYGLL